MTLGLAPIVAQQLFPIVRSLADEGALEEGHLGPSTP
jgi:hypothetical protein